MMSPRNWLPAFKPGVWIQLLPLLVMFALLWITAWTPFRLSFNTVKFWEYLVYAWAYAATVYLLGLVVLVRYLRAWWLAAAFAWIYLLLYAVNAGFIYHMGMMLGPYFVWISNTPTDIAYVEDYFTRWVVILTVFLLLSGILATWLIRKNAKTLAAAHSRWLIVLTALLWVAPVLQNQGVFRPTAVATAVVHAKSAGVWRVDQTYSLRALSENPLVILGRVVFVHRLKPLQLRPAFELSAMAEILKAWQLPLGPRSYAPLGLKPFNQIVMFGTESLSLDFLSPYNTNLPPDLTPFYGSPAIANAMFLNYQCIAFPTQPGLAATYNSHPNIGGLLTGNFELSLIKQLDAQGYDTYFLTSGPETFLNNNVIFKKMGFQHVIGSQTWMTDPRYQPFIEDRGLMDQMLYQIALDILEQHRGKKIFIQIMNGDTHSPYPRSDYGSLQYPPVPTSIARATSDPQVQAILTGIFKHDYDVGQTIQKMRDRNLLTENTLVILTADHNFPHGEALSHIPGYPATFFVRIPLAFLGGQPLPHADLRQIHSQLDFAPTLMHLLGLPIPDGWWGESIFAPDQNAPIVSKFGRNLTVTPFGGGPARTISLDHPKDAAEAGLVELFLSAYTNSPASGAAMASTGSQTNSP